MTVGTQIAVAVDISSNRAQAVLLAEYAQRVSLPIDEMPTSALLFLIAVPCWMEGI